MKKALKLFLALSMVLSLVSFTPVMAEDKVLFAESFEDGMEKWIYTNSSRCNESNTGVSSDYASEGKNGAYVFDEDDKTYGMKTKDNIPAKAGTTYKITGDIYNVEGVGAKIFLTFYDAGGTRLLSKSISKSDTGKWISVSLTEVAPEGTENIIIILTGAGASTGKTYIDNIKLYEGAAAGGESAGGISPAPSVSASEGDVIVSDSFEDGLDWRTYSSKTGSPFEITQNEASEGKASLRIYDESTENAAGIRSGDYINIKEFNKYRLSAKAKGNVTVKVYLRIYDKDKKQLIQKSKTGKSDNWQEYFVDMETPYGAAMAEIIITTDNSTTGEIFVDEVKLIDMGEGKADYDSAKLQETLNEKLKNAKPGDVIEIDDGTYNDVSININVSGTEANPIILKAKNPGKVVFSKASTLKITGSYIHVKDLSYIDCYGASETILRFEPDSRYCVLDGCLFLNCNPVDAKGKVDPNAKLKWVYIQGKYNTVKNCYFSGKATVGQMVEVVRRTAEADYHTIKDCYFGDIKMGSVNGLETFRIGTSQESLSGSYSTLSGSFFEACNGEVETISIKSCNNYILNNTLYNTQGAIVLRHGNDNLVEGNLVIGGDKTARPTGVRIIGENHKVVNNYFYNLPVTSTAVYVMDTNPNPLIHEYLEIKNADVSNNSFINCDLSIMPGEYLPSDTNSSNRVIPPEGKITNNAVISFKGDLPSMPNREPNHKLTFENNKFYGKAIGYGETLPQGVSYEKPEYTFDGKYIKFTDGTGADLEKVKKAPTSPFDIIPKWVKEQYYDTGKITFTPVAGDPFNTDLDITKVLPDTSKINVVINGIAETFDVDPQIINSRTMVPMRAIFERFGAEVNWDEPTATATASLDGITVKITRDSDKAYVGNKEYTLDSPAVIIDGRFLVPLRFVSESFGANVGWIPETQTATISYVSRKVMNEFLADNGIEGALAVKDFTESGNDGSNAMENIFDGNINSKWAVKKASDSEMGYGIIDLGSVKTLDGIHIACQAHPTRIYTYEFYVSEDGVNYTLAVDKTSTKNYDGKFEAHKLNGIKAQYVKYVGYGNSENDWNNVSEIVITGK